MASSSDNTVRFISKGEETVSVIRKLSTLNAPENPETSKVKFTSLTIPFGSYVNEEMSGKGSPPHVK
jgi:hypothetical protein